MDRAYGIVAFSSLKGGSRRHAKRRYLVYFGSNQIKINSQSITEGVDASKI